MELRIALNNGSLKKSAVSDETRCGYLDEVYVIALERMREVMPNRDALVVDSGIKINGSISSWSIEENPDNGRKELVIQTRP